MKMFFSRIAVLAGAAALSLVANAGLCQDSKPATGEELTKQLDEIFNTEKYQHAHWGIRVEKLDGTVVYDRTGEKGFVPASNQKIFTTAAALEMLGPDYKYETNVYAIGPIEEGILKGDLLIVGSGDPTLGAWHPNEDVNSDQLLAGWIEKVKAAGIKKVSGNIIGDGRIFNEEYINGEWWCYGDLPYWYAAGSSGLAMEENAFRIKILPGKKVGDKAELLWTPPTDYITIINSVETVEAGGRSNADAVWRGDNNEFLYDRTIAIDKDVINERGSVLDGARYAAYLFREALDREGIPVYGDAVNIRDLPDIEAIDKAEPRVKLATTVSPPLSATCSVINEVSHNFFADQVFRTLSVEKGGNGSWDHSSSTMKDWMKEIGAPDAENYNQLDGSGLAHGNFCQPRQMTYVLRHMRTLEAPAGEAFYNSLSRAGESGWLRNRLKDAAVKGNVRAKTGYIGYVRSLSGYVTGASGDELVFAMFCNNYTTSVGEVDEVIDKAVTVLANFEEK